MAPDGAGPRCPDGHLSVDPDWCDVCGLAVAAPAAAARGVSLGSPAPSCAVCGDELDGRFCETCGHDSLAAPPPPAPPEQARVPVPTPPRAWHAVVRADQDWFSHLCRQDGVDAAALAFPQYAAERRFVLTGPQVTIGRRSASRGTIPEIDLTGLDPGVSAAHALLVARPDGGWELVDVGSTNGTTLVVDDGPIPPHRPFPLADGAVIHLGAWTTITLTATSETPAP